MLLEAFLELNGYTLDASDQDAFTAILAVAAGEMDDAAFLDWIQANTVKL